MMLVRHAGRVRRVGIGSFRGRRRPAGGDATPSKAPPCSTDAPSLRRGDLVRPCGRGGGFADSRAFLRISSSIAAPALVALLVLAASVVVLPPARAESGIAVADTLEADPGTIAGTVGALGSSDDVRATVSEEDVTALADAEVWLRPQGDSVAGFTYRGNCAGNEYECLDDNPVHDGNSTFLAGNGATPGDESQYFLQNWPAGAGTDVVIASLTPWSIARVNGSLHAYSINVVAGDLTDCATSSFVLTQAFTNVTGSAQVAVCGTAEAWTPASVFGAYFEHRETHPQSDLVTVTATGVTATYSDSDFQVQAYVNFTGVRGVTHVLRYEGSTSLADSTGLELQVLRGATWITIVSSSPGFLGASESSELLTLNDGGRDVSEGRVRFRIVDTELDEETGESFSLDEFVIMWDDQQPPPPTGGDPAEALGLACQPRMLEIPCRVRLNASVLDTKIVQTQWSIAIENGPPEFAGIGSSVGDREQIFTFPVPFLPGTVYNVSVRILFDNNQDLAVSVAVVHDNTWIVTLVSITAILLVAAIAARSLYVTYRREGPKRRKGGENYRVKLWEDPHRGP